MPRRSCRSPVGDGRPLAVLLVAVIALALGGCAPRADPQATFRELTMPFEGASRPCLPFGQQPSFSFGWLNRGGPVTRPDDGHRVTAALQAVEAPPELVGEELRHYLASLGFVPTDVAGRAYRRADGEVVTVEVSAGQGTVSARARIEVVRPGRFRDGPPCPPPGGQEPRP